MIGVLNTSMAQAWATLLGDTPWPLLPVANRPLLDYWLETCADAGVERVFVMLGEGAKAVEDFIGDGERWNLRVEYTFARSGEDPLTYLRSIAEQWEAGLIYFGAPFFARRRKAFRSEGIRRLDACRHDLGGAACFIFGRDAEEIAPLLIDAENGGRGLEQIHAHPYAIADLNAYFELNIKMVAAEFSRYVTAGFSGGDGSSVGYNTRTPPSSHLIAPIIIGDDCRFGAMTTIGPNAVVGNHVIVDAYTELANCLILDDTYIGRNLEIRDKIVAGKRVIDPRDGAVIEIEDSWIVARNRPEMKTEDFVRETVLWCVALVIACAQLIPFALLLPWVLMSRVATFERQRFHDPSAGYITLPVFTKLQNKKSILYRLFRGFSLDRFPWILRVLRGRMFLCGQPPMRHPEDDEIIQQLPRYYPGVFCYQDYNRDSDRLTDSLWYAHIRSMYEDVKILIKALVTRFLTAGRQ